DRRVALRDRGGSAALEAAAPARDRARLLPLRLLGQLAPPAGQPRLELVERPPPVGGVRFELAAHLPESILERAVEVGAEPGHARSLLLAFGRQPLGVRGESQLDLAQELLVSLLELDDAGLRRFCGAVEILRPAREPLLDLRLNLVELVAESCRRVVLTLGDHRAALLRDLPFLLLEERARVGPGARERELELLPERGLLL